jgi:hypothetical protein
MSDDDVNRAGEILSSNTCAVDAASAYWADIIGTDKVVDLLHQIAAFNRSGGPGSRRHAELCTDAAARLIKGWRLKEGCCIHCGEFLQANYHDAEGRCLMDPL